MHLKAIPWSPTPITWILIWSKIDLLIDICWHKQVAKLLGIISWDQQSFSFEVRLKRVSKVCHSVWISSATIVEKYPNYIQRVFELLTSFHLLRDCVFPHTRIRRAAEKFIDLWINKKSQRSAQAVTQDSPGRSPWRWGKCNLLKLFLCKEGT